MGDEISVLHVDDEPGLQPRWQVNFSNANRTASLSPPQRVPTKDSETC